MNISYVGVARVATIPALYALGLLGIVSSSRRVGMTLENMQAAPLALDWVDQRYADHPLLTLIHVVPGLIFLLVGPLQFSTNLRARAVNVHRWLGRIFVVSGVLSALSIMWMVIVFPAMGGVSTMVTSWMFSILMIWFLFEAYRSIRARNIKRHRAFMMRAFTIGLAVSTIRVLAILSDAVLGLDFVEFFGLSVFLGFVLNSFVAEVLIWGKKLR